MNELNLHNRLPKDLPNRETIKDILLELEDTNKFDINIINLQSNKVDGKVDGNKWYANNRTFNEWVENGEIVVCEIDSPVRAQISRLYQDESDFFTPSFASVKETRYNIFRYPMRISVNFKPGILPLNKGSVEIIETSKDVYLRLKDYLGPDVIQDNYFSTTIRRTYGVDFIIDFMISKVRLSTEICS